MMKTLRSTLAVPEPRVRFTADDIVFQVCFKLFLVST